MAGRIVAALALVTLLGVVGGQTVLRLIPAAVLRKVSSAAFILMGVLMWFEVL